MQTAGWRFRVEGEGVWGKGFGKRRRSYADRWLAVEAWAGQRPLACCMQYAAFADKDQVMYTYIICIDHMDVFFYMNHRRGPSACCNAFAIDRVVETNRDTVMVLARASRYV